MLLLKAVRKLVQYRRNGLLHVRRPVLTLRIRSGEAAEAARAVARLGVAEAGEVVVALWLHRELFPCPPTATGQKSASRKFRGTVGISNWPTTNHFINGPVVRDQRNSIEKRCGTIAGVSRLNGSASSAR